jgi:hypothetical protein
MGFNSAIPFDLIFLIFFGVYHLITPSGLKPLGAKKSRQSLTAFGIV